MRKASEWTNRMLAGATEIRPGEGPAVLAAALLFFLILSAVILLRPVRDAMGLTAGMEQVRRLFLGTVAATFVVVPAFGWLAARAPRRLLLAISLRCCAAALCLFYAASIWWSPAACAPVYYIFHSVFNLLVVFLFWALMADLFSLAESKRLFPPIAVGGTLGALAGAMGAQALAERIGPVRLFLVAAALLELAVWAARLAVWTRRGHSAGGAAVPALGGGAWAGLVDCLRSPYLSGVCGYSILAAIASTFLYFMQLRIVEAASSATDVRTTLFAHLDVWTQAATLVAQVFLAGRIMRVLGVGVALSIMPVLAAAGLALLAWRPVLGTYAAVNAAYRAAQRGVARPARETLFTVVRREEKYKAKSFIDVFVFRAGDAAGAQLDGLLRAVHLGSLGVGAAGLVLAAAWTALAVGLAQAQARRAGKSAASVG